MPDRSFAPLGEAEMEMLQHVWHLGEATVADVHERVLKDREVAYNTVLTILGKLENKGYLRRRKEGRAYVYAPDRRPEEVQSSFLEAILDRVFSGSPIALAQALATQEQLTDAERGEIETLIEKMHSLEGGAEDDGA
jgi:predicted transcriptional regulator